LPEHIFSKGDTGTQFFFEIVFYQSLSEYPADLYRDSDFIISIRQFFILLEQILPHVV
jgi:hypothetical protein